jgi:hypothetical protein
MRPNAFSVNTLTHTHSKIIDDQKRFTFGCNATGATLIGCGTPLKAEKKYISCQQQKTAQPLVTYLMELDLLLELQRNEERF